MRGVDRFFIFCTQSNLLGETFFGEFFAIKPWESLSQARAPMDFILDNFVDCENVLFLTEFNSNRRPDTLGKPKIGIRVKQNKHYLLNST